MTYRRALEMDRRARPRRRNGRLDAAVDAMRPYGFPEKLVCRTVKELLQVYGGDDGWPFIEGEGYMPLIEKIIEKQENVVRQENPMGSEGEVSDAKLSKAVPSVNALPQGLSKGSEGETSAAGPVNAAPSPASDNVECGNRASQPNEATDSSPANETLEPEQSMNKPGCRSEKKQLGSVTRNEEEVKVSVAGVLSPPSVQNNRNRRPFHGWIADDTDEEDLVYLPPALSVDQLAEVIHSMVGKKKRKSGWDVKPGDMSE